MIVQRTDKVVTCKMCQAELGRVYLVGDDVEALMVGRLLVFDLIKGVCVSCGAPFFYSIPLKRFESVVDRLFSDDEWQAKARQMRREGKSYGEIAKALNLPRSTVWRMFQK